MTAGLIDVVPNAEEETTALDPPFRRGDMAVNAVTLVKNAVAR